MRNKPRIRFKGFTEDWEQRKLGDVANVRDGTHDSPKFYNDGFPLVTSKNLKDGSIDFSDCSFISEQDFDEINKRSKVDPGDILFGMIGTIGKPAIVEYTGFAIKNVALIKEGNIINNRFIYHLLSSKVFDNYIARENAGGTQKFIALNQIRNFIFSAPTLAEQNKIIELLDYISQIITLHQRKLEKLKLAKKALLQKLFPKNGSKFPELRFKGFADAWEQRKLNDLVTIRRGLTYKPSDIAENGIRVLRSSNIDEDQFITSNDDVFVNIETVNIPFAKNGDILITSANGSNRLVGKHTIISDIADNSAVHGGFMLLAESNNPLFTDALLSSNWYKRFINTYVAGGNGAIGNLSKSDLESQTVMIPSDHEQAKIGQWYDNINQLITLHQRKLDKLQEVKKGLLQKMFV